MPGPVSVRTIRAHPLSYFVAVSGSAAKEFFLLIKEKTIRQNKRSEHGSERHTVQFRALPLLLWV